MAEKGGAWRLESPPPHNIGQCEDCGRVYDIGAEGNAGPKRILPEKRQPPVETSTTAAGVSGHGHLRGHTSLTRRKQVGRWEGRGVSHGYCPDCEKRGSVYLQSAGPERGAKFMGKSEQEAKMHWWWRKPPRLRRGQKVGSSEQTSKIVPN